VVTLPKEFVATKLPGYFFNTVTEKLYSIKVAGVLRELSRQYPDDFNHGLDGYSVSHKGNPRRLEMRYLKSIQPSDTVIKVEHKRTHDGVA
jgi:hypothetical protein